MPRSSLALIACSLRASLDASIQLGNVLEQTDPAVVGPGNAQELLDAASAQFRALAQQIGAAKSAFKASKGNPTLGGFDDLVTAGGWADTAEAEAHDLQVAALGFATKMSLAGFRVVVR